MTTPLRIALFGAAGRMGTRIRACAERDPRFIVTIARDRENLANTAENAHFGVDVVIDFSTDEGTREALALARAHACPLLVGTTALRPETIAEIGAFSRGLAALISANTSVGVAVLRELAALAARMLGPSFDIDLVESHHHHKRDAPSGTALHLQKAVQEAGGALSDERVHAIRAGGIIGEHEIIFTSSTERITLAHHALDRDLFALGALRTAEWLVQQPAGLYAMRDVWKAE